MRLHPGSWWLVAIALISLASSASLQFLMVQVLILASLGLLIREQTSMAASAKLYVFLAIGVFATRVFFRLIFNYEPPGALGETQVVIGIPRLEIQFGWLGSIKLFGEMSAASFTSAITDGLRLAAIILSVGLANTLAAPKRLISAVPSALYELAIALSIALNFAPSIISGFERVRRVQRLRGQAKKQQLIKRVLIPVLEDALSQSFDLAASMANRGFGRRTQLSPTRKLLFRVVAIFTLISFAISTSLWVASDQIFAASIALFSGVLGAVFAIRIAAPHQKRTLIHPLRFTLVDWLVSFSSISIAAAAIVGWLS